MDLNKKVSVRNRAKGSISYTIDALRVTRSWATTGAVINIPINELIELTTIPGGQKLLDKYLVIEDKEALSAVYDYELAPEYNYGETEIDYLLHNGTNEQLLDALDYAPQGVLDLIRTMSIKKMPDTTVKVSAINNKFQINLSNLALNAAETEEDDKEEENTAARRSTPVELEKPIKPAGSKYNVVKTTK